MHKFFPVDVHSTMLSDIERVKKYQLAIDKVVTEQDLVLDVGCGTGILSKFASEKAAKVISIDVSEEATSLTQLISKDKIEVATTSSYEYISSCNPSIVLTETIGQVCFEEYITQICYDLKNKFPNIKKFIPNTIYLYCQVIKSSTINDYIDSIISNYKYYNLLKEQDE
jgi:predicted RNA methylase